MIFFKQRSSLTFFMLFIFVILLMHACANLRRRTGPSVTLPEKKIPSASSLPSESAADILIQEGWKSIDEGNLNLAEQKFEKALRISPTHGKSYLGLARIAYLQMDYMRALEFLQMGEAYSSQQADLLVHLYILEGDCYRDMGRKKEAKKAYQKALEIDSHNPLLIDRLEKIN